MNNNSLTPEEIAQLRDYLTELEKLNESAKKRLTPEQWDIAMGYFTTGEGDRPDFIDQIAVWETKEASTGKIIHTYSDKVQDEITRTGTDLTQKYHDTIKKALLLALSNDSINTEAHVEKILQALVDAVLADNLLASDFLPMLNSAPTNDLMPITKADFKRDAFTKKAIYVTKDGSRYTLEDFSEVQGLLSTTAKKILDTAVLYLTSANFYRAEKTRVNPTVEIPLIEYGEACGFVLTAKKQETPEEQDAENKRVKERIKELKKNIRRDLHDLSTLLWTGEITRGKNKNDYAEMRLISGHSIRNGVIRINFDIDAASMLVNSYIMQYPTVLLKHDSRNPNSYAIGRKIAFHNSNDQNRDAGTECTLSVKSILAAAPEIPTIEDIQSRGQRNWKDKIKKPLEFSLDSNITVGLISKWEYRDPKNGRTYTKETAQPLTWQQYSRLMIDFVMVAEAEQKQRRAKKAAEKVEAEADKESIRRPRGRPKKDP